MRVVSLLLLAAAALTGCDFAPIQAERADPTGQPPRTEDETLAYYGRELAGSWTGLTTVTTLLTVNYAWMNLQWTPETDTPRSGHVKLRCVTDGADCTPTSGLPGGFAFDYSLYSVTEEGKIRGALEFITPEDEVGELTMFELKFNGLDQFEFNAPGGLFAMSGTFDRDPPLLFDAGAPPPPRSP